MVRISQENFPFCRNENITTTRRSEYRSLQQRSLFAPLWQYRNILSFIHTICFNLFPIRPQECVKSSINEDELSCSSFLLHDTLLPPQNNGSEENPENRRRVEQNYYQGHAAQNLDDNDDESTDLDEITTTTDHTVLVHVDKPKNYGTLSSQILSNERLNYMWKNIGECFVGVVVVVIQIKITLNR